MLERYFLHEERQHHYLPIIAISFIITVLLGSINHFIGGNSLFLVALTALALAYPIVNYLRSQNRKEYEGKFSWKSLLERHENELVLFWGVFIGMMLGFYTVLPFLSDLSAQEQFLSQISGNITETSLGFMTILLNNLLVGLFTFLISLVTFSGLVFVLSWNASILAYYLWQITSTKVTILTGLLILPHGLLEIAGYVLLGSAGAVLSYQLDHYLSKKRNMPRQVVLDIAFLITGGAGFILLGALLETL